MAGLTSGYGQYGVRFDHDSFTAKGYQAVYSFESGQLLMLTDAQAARQDGYVFINSDTGEKISSFLIGNTFGGLLTPNGEELLMAGSEGSLRSMGRYNPSSFEVIQSVEINLGDTLANTIGIGGRFEIVPDGNFLFNGVDLPQSVDFMAKYNPDFEQLWATSFHYNGSFSTIGVEAYPLPNGDIGFFVFFNQQNQATGALEVVDVFGLLDGMTGEKKWTFTYRPTLGALNNRLENFRFTFGSDGSFFAHAAAQIDISNINAPVDFSTAKIVRINPDGTLAYSKSVTVTDAIVLGEHYMDGYALLHYSFDDEAKTQFVVLDANGNVTGNTAVDFHLSAGDGDLTATRRSGSNFAFVRASFSPGGETLARLNLADGAMEFKQLPSPFPGNPAYEAIGAVSAYPLAPFNTPRGFSAVSRVIAGEVLNALTSDNKMEIIELPADGRFPDCITYTPSPITLFPPLPVIMGDVDIIDLEDGWSTGAHAGLSGFAAGTLTPQILPMDVTVEVLCEDDGGGAAPGLSFVKISPTMGELSFQTMSGITYTIQKNGVMDGVAPFVNLQQVVGDGNMFSLQIPLALDQEYFQLLIE